MWLVKLRIVDSSCCRTSSILWLNVEGILGLLFKPCFGAFLLLRQVEIGGEWDPLPYRPMLLWHLGIPTNPTAVHLPASLAVLDSV